MKINVYCKTRLIENTASMFASKQSEIPYGFRNLVWRYVRKLEYMLISMEIPNAVRSQL